MNGENIKCYVCDGQGLVTTWSFGVKEPDECKNCGGSGVNWRYESGVTARYYSGPIIGRDSQNDKASIRKSEVRSHQEWVNKASSWLTRHPSYNNTEHGDSKGWRGKHFTAMCFDSVGRRVTNGGDFRRAEEEGAFPVWWIWPDQIVELILRAEGRE